jgi:hypothetical protein
MIQGIHKTWFRIEAVRAKDPRHDLDGLNTAVVTIAFGTRESRIVPESYSPQPLFTSTKVTAVILCFSAGSTV